MTEKTLTVTLTKDQWNFLLGKLDVIINESSPGVDIWLAPGGVLDVNEADSNAECFCDFDADLPQFVEIFNKIDEVSNNS